MFLSLAGLCAIVMAGRLEPQSKQKNRLTIEIGDAHRCSTVSGMFLAASWRTWTHGSAGNVLSRVQVSGLFVIWWRFPFGYVEGWGPTHTRFHACCRYAESDMRPEGKGGVATTRPGATSLQLNPSAICVYKYNIAPRLAESQPGAERPRRESSHWQELRDLGS